MADSTTAVEIFKPLDQDYALTGLRKLFGCMVDQLWKAAGACSDSSNVLVQGLAWFNGGVLILAGIVACYLLYSLVADTANDGEAFGRSTDTRYTLLRTGIGAALFLPIQNGLSLVQLLVIQAAIWSSGFGDTLWTKIAGTNLTGMYSTPDLSTLRPPDFTMRKTVADALRARTYGYVCKYSLENASKILSGGTTKTINSDSSTTQTAAGWFQNGAQVTRQFFRDTTGYYRSSTSLCGSVSYTASLPMTLSGSGVGQSADQSYAQILYNLTQTAATTAMSAAWSKIDSAANSIAIKVTGGNNPDAAAQRNSEDIRAAIAQAVDDATQTLTSSLTSQIASTNSTLDQAKTQYLDLSRQNGWITAVLWQRSMASIYAKLTSIVNSAQLNSTLPANPADYLPLFSSWREGYNAAVDQARRDMDFIVTFDTYFTTLGQATAPALATETVGSQSNEAQQVADLVNQVYRAVLTTIAQPESTTWRDPYLEIQKVGSALGPWVMGLGATTAATGVTSALVPGGVGSLASVATTMLLAVTITLFVIAFVIGGLLPLLPVLYFLAAAIGWFLIVVEAMIAMPIWLITKFFPARSPSLVGDSRRGYVFLLGLLIRPALIVIGLIASIVMARVGLDLINMVFRGILVMMVPDGGYGSIFAALAGLVAYTLALVSLVGFSSSLITLLPETVLGWIDATLMSGATQDLGRSLAGEASQRPGIGRMEPRNTIPTRGPHQPGAAPQLSSSSALGSAGLSRPSGGTGLPGLPAGFARPLSLAGPATPRAIGGSSSPRALPPPPRALPPS